MGLLGAAALGGLNYTLTKLASLIDKTNAIHPRSGTPSKSLQHRLLDLANLRMAFTVNSVK
jgi:hypothetical protein